MTPGGPRGPRVMKFLPHLNRWRTVESCPRIGQLERVVYYAMPMDCINCVHCRDYRPASAGEPPETLCGGHG